MATRTALVLLVLFMLGLLGWQLHQELRSQERFERERVVLHGEQMAQRISLTLELKAVAAQALLQQELSRDHGDIRATLITGLKHIYPSFHSLVRLDAGGAPLSDSASSIKDTAFIEALRQRSAQQPYHYAFSEENGGHFYVWLKATEPGEEDSVIRLDEKIARRGWAAQIRPESPDWILVDSVQQKVLGRSSGYRPGPLSAASPLEQAQSLDGLEIQNTDWQLRPQFDERQMRTTLLPRLGGELALLLVLAGIAGAALLRLQREQQNLRALTVESQQSLRQAAQALGAIDERVLVTRADGRLAYLNPQAEQLFGIAAGKAGEHHLLELLPGLGGLLASSDTSADNGSELVRVNDAGQARLFAVSHHSLDDSPLAAEQTWVLRGNLPQGGQVWVLRDVTEEQQALHILEETRRRYQDIFDGVGVALCVLDLSALRQSLVDLNLRRQSDLRDWIASQPERLPWLLRQVRITEINNVAKRLMRVTNTEQAWQVLIGSAGMRPDGVRSKVLEAVLHGQGMVELEACITTRQGEQRHLWLQLRVPEMIQDFHAVTLSLSDITSRKQVELSLIEREKFWSDAVRAVPDTLYIHDIAARRVIFTNHNLGYQLGYSGDELRDMGERFWEKVLHPDDVEYYWRVRNLQQVVGDGLLLDSQLRWRHRDGSWHWFDIREQALTRDDTGRVARLIGVAKDITDTVEAHNSLRESGRRYRMLAESISDVILSTDAQVKLNYISPSIQQVFGYSPEWVLANGFQQVAANPAQLERLEELLHRVQGAIGEPKRLAELRESAEPQLFSLDCLHADGHKIPVELRIALMWDDHGRFEGLLGVARDVSQQRRAEREMRMAATVFEHSTAAIMVTDPAGYIVQINDSFSRLTGYSAEEVLDQLPRLLTADRQEANQLKHVLESLRKSGSWEGEILQKRKSGELYPSWVGITAVHDDEGDLVSFVCFFSDISERKASERRIHRLAYYDALTHLPNRTLFQDRLHTALQQAERPVGGADVPRPGPLQADQRLPRPRRGRPHAQGSGRAPEPLRQRRRHRGAHGRRRVHLAVARPEGPREGAPAGDPGGRADSFQPCPPLHPGRPRVLRHRQHRRGALAAGRRRAQPVDEERRHRDVPRQGDGQEQLPVLPGRDERPRPGAPGTGKRPAPGHRAGRIHSPLPATVHRRRPPPDRRRGATALAASQARADSADGVHPGAGRAGPGCPGRRLAAGAGVPATASLAPRQGAGAEDFREPLGPAVRRRPVGRTHRQHPRRHRHRPGLPGAGAD